MSSNIKEILTDLGDPVRVSHLIDILQVNVDDFKDSRRGDKVRDVIKYLLEHPDPAFFVRHALGSKQVDRIDFMDEYIQITEQKYEQDKLVDAYNQEIEVYRDKELEPEEQQKYDRILEEKEIAETTAGLLGNELNHYEI